MVAALEDQGNVPTIVGDARLKQAERRGKRITARLDGEFEMVARIIGGGVRRKAAGRAMLKALVDGQNDHFSGAAQATMIKQTGQVGTDTRIFAGVPA